MKKIIIIYLACFAMIQSSHAAVSPLSESLRELEAINLAIGTNPDFQNVIPQNESIVAVKRVTKELNALGRVEYKILTRSANYRGGHCSIKYLATLDIAPNSGIGPYIIAVVSIESIN